MIVFRAREACHKLFGSTELPVEAVDMLLDN